MQEMWMFYENEDPVGKGLLSTWQVVIFFRLTRTTIAAGF
jgi:hypothetical protein